MLVIRCSDEDAAPGEVVGDFRVRNAVPVSLSRDKGLDGLDVHLPHALELGDLVDPHALDLLGCCLVPHILESQRV